MNIVKINGIEFDVATLKAAKWIEEHRTVRVIIEADEDGRLVGRDAACENENMWQGQTCESVRARDGKDYSICLVATQDGSGCAICLASEGPACADYSSTCEIEDDEGWTRSEIEVADALGLDLDELNCLPAADDYEDAAEEYVDSHPGRVITLTATAGSRTSGRSIFCSTMRPNQMTSGRSATRQRRISKMRSWMRTPTMQSISPTSASARSRDDKMRAGDHSSALELKRERTRDSVINVSIHALAGDNGKYIKMNAKLSRIRAAAGRRGGEIGGKSTSPAKVAAAKANGMKGGRPRKLK